MSLTSDAALAWWSFSFASHGVASFSNMMAIARAMAMKTLLILTAKCWLKILLLLAFFLSNS